MTSWESVNKTLDCEVEKKKKIIKDVDSIRSLNKLLHDYCSKFSERNEKLLTPEHSIIKERRIYLYKKWHEQIKGELEELKEVVSTTIEYGGLEFIFNIELKLRLAEITYEENSFLYFLSIKNND